MSAVDVSRPPRPGRSATFLVVLAAPWTGTAGATLEQLGAVPGLFVLGCAFVESTAGVGVELREAGLRRPARSMTLGVDEEAVRGLHSKRSSR
jgi:hypothetical protein